jgi:hypothetical protein
MIANRALALSIRAIGVIRGFCFLAAMVAGNSARADSPMKLDAPESTRIARARFERDRADLRELLMARAAAARGCYEARQREFFNGRDSPTFLLNASLWLLNAEDGLENSPSGRKDALERYWERTRVIEAIQKDGFEAGRVSLKDYTHPKEKRLQAEIWLAKAKAGHAGEAARSPWVYDDPRSGTDEKGLAKARFRASEADIRDLLRQRYEAALVTWGSRAKEFLAGRGTLDFLHEAALSLVEAELELDGSPADRLAALERYWEFTKLGEEINRQRFEDGRIAVQDLFESKYQRIVAEIRLGRARAAIGEVRENSRRPGMWWYEDAFRDDSGSQKALAKARYAASTSDLQQLARERRDAARIVYQAREKEFENGRGTLRFLLDWSQRLLDSELALAHDRSERLAALERHWERAIRTELANKDRFDRGRIAIQDYLETKFARLDAEIQLAHARAETNPKRKRGQATNRLRFCPRLRFGLVCCRIAHADIAHAFAETK